MTAFRTPDASASATSATDRPCSSDTPCDPVEMINEDVGGLALLVEQSGLGEEGEEHFCFSEHLVDLGHHLGRIKLETDLAQIAAPPACEVAVDVCPLVMEQPLWGGIRVETSSRRVAQAANRRLRTAYAASHSSSASGSHCDVPLPIAPSCRLRYLAPALPTKRAAEPEHASTSPAPSVSVPSGYVADGSTS